MLLGSTLGHWPFSASFSKYVEPKVIRFSSLCTLESKIDTWLVLRLPSRVLDFLFPWLSNMLLEDNQYVSSRSLALRWSLIYDAANMRFLNYIPIYFDILGLMVMSI